MEKRTEQKDAKRIEEKHPNARLTATSETQSMHDFFDLFSTQLDVGQAYRHFH